MGASGLNKKKTIQLYVELLIIIKKITSNFLVII